MKRLGILFCVSFVFIFTSYVDAAGIVDTTDTNTDDFARGVDISSIISLEESGVEFSDSDANIKDIFYILKDNGIN